MEAEVSRKFYQKKWFAILSLIFLHLLVFS